MSIVRSHSAAMAGFREGFKRVSRNSRGAGWPRRPARKGQKPREANSTDQPVSKSYPQSPVKSRARVRVVFPGGEPLTRPVACLPFSVTLALKRGMGPSRRPPPRGVRRGPPGSVDRTAKAGSFCCQGSLAPALLGRSFLGATLARFPSLSRQSPALDRAYVPHAGARPV